ncbi:MAG: NUMOD4 domain-containing protein [Clostridia bacterium]
MEEIWKDIKGYENLYKISSLGNVYSLINNKKRKLKLSKAGYLIIDLYKNGEGKWYRVHRLVAETFIPNPNNYPIVLHLDNNKTNNNYINLKWGTVQENTQQAYNDNLIDNSQNFLLTNEHNKIICKGYEELIELTGYKKSSIAEYIKTGNIIKRGKFKGYKILK